MGPRLEDFQILDTIGRGTHGIVRKVKRIKDGQILVWKELYYASMSDVEKQGLVLEVNLLRELCHPNIVRFYHHVVDRNSGTLYIFMEYCPGGDLRQLVSKCNKNGNYIEESFIWKVLKQVCEALSTCHEKHVNGEAIVLHRDIKPANVFLDDEGNVKLGDFGLAKTLNSDASFARTFVGTPYYMSPEVVDGSDYNERSDIWSLGCLIYELCALHPPFKADTQRDLAVKIKAGRYDRIPIHYSNKLWEMIGLMLTQDNFLRPTALMILYHSSLVANTSTTKVGTDGLLGLSNSLNVNNCSNKEASEFIPSTSKKECNNSLTDISAVNELSTELSPGNSLMETVKERIMTEEEKQMEESLMKEVEALMLESNMRKAKWTTALYASIGIKDLPYGDGPISEDFSVPNINCNSSNSTSTHDIKNVESPPKCICGGMSHDEWRARLSSVRKSESLVKEKELALNDKERELAKKEKRIQALEQETKHNLIRAQIYLRHAKEKIHSVGLPTMLKNNLEEDCTDFDATTVSGDIGYEPITTVAFLNTNSSENPFLKMRRKLSISNDEAVWDLGLNRSHTLDNPKSYKKHDNHFCLELDRENDSLNRSGKGIIEISNINVSSPNLSGKENDIVRSSTYKTVSNECAKISLNKKSLSNKTSINKDIVLQPNLENSKLKVEPLKANSANIFTTIKNNFSRNNSRRKSKEILRGKENRVVLEAGKTKYPISKTRKENTTKGICAKPEIKVALKPRLSNCDHVKRGDGNKDKIFRFYNAV